MFKDLKGGDTHYLHPDHELNKGIENFAQKVYYLYEQGYPFLECVKALRFSKGDIKMSEAYLDGFQKAKT